MMIKMYNDFFNNGKTVSDEDVLLSNKMMAAKVFKKHNRDINPEEVEEVYSIEDFCKKGKKLFEKCQFYIKKESEVFDINEASFFEIKRQTLKTDS